MTASTARHRLAVVGGGIAGLTAAREVLASGVNVDVTLFEGSSDVGGKLRLGEVGGVQVDLGAESMLSRRPEGVCLAGDLGLSDAVVHPAATGAGIWTRGEVRPLPPSLMGIPTDVTAATRSGILSRVGGIRAMVEPRLPAADVTDDVGVGVFVARRLGREVRDRLVEPVLGGVYAGRADEISLHAALPQVVDAVRKHGSLLEGARSALAASSANADEPVFAGLVGGMGRLVAELAGDIERRGGTVRANAVVRELARTSGGWRLVVGPAAAPETLMFDAVIVAAPAAPTARLLRDVAPLAARELGRIEYASMALVTLALDAAGIAIELDGTGFLVPPIDARMIKAATYSTQKWAWMSGETAIIRCSVGRFREEADLQRDDSELIDGAVMDLREAVGLHAPVLDARVTRWGGALPQYAVGHVERVRRVNEAIADVPALEVCGAAYDGVGIPAVIATAQGAATRVVAAISPVDTMDA